MSEATDKIREWSRIDREFADNVAEQVAASRFIGALGEKDARSSQAEAQAGELEASAATARSFADGWDTIAQAVEDQVDDPNQH